MEIASIEDQISTIFVKSCKPLLYIQFWFIFLGLLKMGSQNVLQHVWSLQVFTFRFLKTTWKYCGKIGIIKILCNVLFLVWTVPCLFALRFNWIRMSKYNTIAQLFWLTAKPKVKPWEVCLDPSVSGIFYCYKLIRSFVKSLVKL